MSLALPRTAINVERGPEGLSSEKTLPVSPLQLVLKGALAAVVASRLKMEVVELPSAAATDIFACFERIHLTRQDIRAANLSEGP